MAPKSFSTAAAILLFFLFAGWLAPRAKGQQGTKIPVAVIEAFHQKYPRAGEVNWEELDGLFIVSLFLDNYYIDAFFQKDGAWLESTIYIDQLELPATIRQSISARFAGIDLYDSVTRTETPAGLTYQVSFEYLGKLIFLKLDASGKILEEKVNSRL
jgi:hypothetical protein